MRGVDAAPPHTAGQAGPLGTAAAATHPKQPRAQALGARRQPVESTPHGGRTHKRIHWVSAPNPPATPEGAAREGGREGNPGAHREGDETHPKPRGAAPTAGKWPQGRARERRPRTRQDPARKGGQQRRGEGGRGARQGEGEQRGKGRKRGRGARGRPKERGEGGQGERRGEGQQGAERGKGEQGRKRGEGGQGKGEGKPRRCTTPATEHAARRAGREGREGDEPGRPRPTRRLGGAASPMAMGRRLGAARHGAVAPQRRPEGKRRPGPGHAWWGAT